MTQEHLWGLDQLLPGAPFSNMPYAVRLTGALNVPALEQSFNEIIKRHEALRTTFTSWQGSQCRLLPNPALASPCARHQRLAQANGKATTQRLIQVEALHPFDLETALLLQVRLLRLGEQEHILLLTTASHHQ